MLPATVRLRHRVDFDAVVRRGQRCGHGPLAVHVCPDMRCTAVGFIVSRAVGNAVTRNRVTRQLRHLMRDRYRSLPPGTGVVVRALPAAAGRSSADLGRSLDRALARALDRAANKVRDNTTSTRSTAVGSATS
ncbi:MAG: ribonuclease P protein component [Geodermatophilaceae bacterium]